MKGEYTVLGLFPPEGDGMARHYADDELPEWIKAKLAIVQMLEPMNEIPGVGRRVARNVYWLEFEEKEVRYGDNA
jgi:hypothetical protein